jgi:hypothetical protein
VDEPPTGSEKREAINKKSPDHPLMRLWLALVQSSESEGTRLSSSVLPVYKTNSIFNRQNSLVRIFKPQTSRDSCFIVRSFRVVAHTTFEKEQPTLAIEYRVHFSGSFKILKSYSQLDNE